jgi:KDO2-lipid IV(A) lauroyltransferase
MGTHLGLWLLRVVAKLPLSWLRALGAALGVCLFYVVLPRRHVALTNLRLCFPEWSEAQRWSVARSSFVHFTQAWLDRGWLWHASEAVLRARLTIRGETTCLSERQPTILFVPHFVGLDAGSVALVLNHQTPITAIITPQANLVVDRWVRQQRQRWGHVTLLQREDGVRPIVSALRRGEFLHLSPDMSFGLAESVFVPFYGQSVATVPSLSRFAKMARARVIPMTSRMTPQGYEVVLHEPWTDFPSDDAVADTALMNQRLEGLINDMPAQYFWVHKRFKTRQPGMPEVY